MAIENSTIIFYNTSTGQIISVISGTGDLTEQIELNRPVGAGMTIMPGDYFPDFFTDYFPSGVYTTRPKLSSVATWDKETLRGDGTDTATLGTGLPNPTYLRLLPQEAPGVSEVEGTCVDGSASITFQTAGVYHILAQAWPYQDETYILGVDIHLPDTRRFIFTGFPADEINEYADVRFILTGNSNDILSSFAPYLKNFTTSGLTISEHTNFKPALHNFAFTGGSSVGSKNRVTPTSGSYISTMLSTEMVGLTKNNIGTYNLNSFSSKTPSSATYSKGSYNIGLVYAMTPSSVKSDINNFIMTQLPLDFGVDCELGSFISTFNDALEE